MSEYSLITFVGISWQTFFISSFPISLIISSKEMHWNEKLLLLSLFSDIANIDG